MADATNPYTGNNPYEQTSNAPVNNSVSVVDLPADNTSVSVVDSQPANTVPYSLDKAPVSIITPKEAVKDINKITTGATAITDGMKAQQAKNVISSQVNDIRTTEKSKDKNAEALKQQELALKQQEIDNKNKAAQTLATAQEEQAKQDLLTEKGIEVTNSDFWASNPNSKANLEALKNGTYVQGQTTGETPTTPTTPVKKSADQIAYDLKQAEQDSINADLTAMENGTHPLTTSEQADIDSLKSSYSSMIKDQQLANKNYEQGTTVLGIRSGRSRYAGEMEMGNIQGAVNDGLKKVREIESAMNRAVRELTTAIEDKDYAKMSNQYNRISAQKQEKANAIAATAKAVEDEKIKQEKIRQDDITSQLKYADLDLKITAQELASNKFSYEQRQDAITNILANDKQTWQEKQDLVKNMIESNKLKLDEKKFSAGEVAEAKKQDLEYKKYLLDIEKAKNAETTDKYKDWKATGGNNSGRSYPEFLLDIGKTKGRPLPLTAATNLSEGKQIPLVTKTLLEFLDENNPNYKGDLFGPLEGLLTKNPWDVEHKTVDDDLRRASQIIGKYMEGGVLRETDEKKYREMLPQITDTLPVAKDKLKGIIDLLKQKSNQFLMDYESAGFDVSGFKGKLPGTEPIVLEDFIKESPANDQYVKDLRAQFKDWTPDEVEQFLNSGDATFNGVGGDTNKASDIISKLEAKVDNVKGGQCGAFVNKIAKLGVGDSYQSKMNKMDKSITTPEPGMVFTMPYKNTGHIGFIVGINNDGTATVKDSNYSLDEKVKTHKIAISKMTGFARV